MLWSESPRLEFRCEPFDREALAKVVGEASNAAIDRSPVDQVRYLASYLCHPELDARTILIERPYVDRHWMEEYAGYYATTLAPPAQKAVRLHFLKDSYETEDFLRLVREVAEGNLQEVEKRFEQGYLGYSVIRPLPSVPMGRTVLRPYPGDSRRCFAPAAMANRVHLAGFSFSVEGLPFQQQDRGVGACATAALWSALAKVARTDGQRPPTPLAITRAATAHGVQARTFPAEGFNLDQMASAIHAAGYQPHLFQVSGDADSFALALKCYLRSGIPVIVHVDVDDDGYHERHVMTLAGFRERGESDEGDILIKERQRRLRSRGVTRWYVHDDRLGPYARLVFESKVEEPAIYQLRLAPRESGFERFERESMGFWDALVPLYPKLRLTAEELIQLGFLVLPLIARLAGEDSEDSLFVEPRFELGGDYLASLHGLPITVERKVALATTMLLSRYVGVLSWFLDEVWICDILYDTTDLHRDMRSAPPILAIIPRDARWQASLENARSARLGPRPLIG
jgi:hypothetical protein